MRTYFPIIPAKAGIQILGRIGARTSRTLLMKLDPGLRRDDRLGGEGTPSCP